MRLLCLVFLLMPFFKVNAQADTLSAGLYPWNAHEAKPNKNGESRLILEGKTNDLTRFRVHSSTLLPGITNHPPVAYTDKEEMLIVKSGVLTMVLNGVSKELEAGSVVSMQAGDLQSCTNNSKEPVSYFVIAWVSKDSMQLQRGKQAGGSEMKAWKEMELKPTDKGASRPIIRKPTAMFPLFDIHATTLNAGKASHAPHTHRNEEMILLIEGSGEMLIGDKVYKAGTYDALYVSPMIPHAFTNTGNIPCTYFAIQWQR
jgi:(S)-ureidoglycine aminohydrolase